MIGLGRLQLLLQISDPFILFLQLLLSPPQIRVTTVIVGERSILVNWESLFFRLLVCLPEGERGLASLPSRGISLQNLVDELLDEELLLLGRLRDPQKYQASCNTLRITRVACEYCLTQCSVASMLNTHSMDSQTVSGLAQDFSIPMAKESSRHHPSG
jgi:hypothetical protein